MRASTVPRLGTESTLALFSAMKFAMSCLPLTETTGMPPAVLSISLFTRAGYFAAKMPETQPPSDSPERCAASIFSASISSRSCSAKIAGL